MLFCVAEDTYRVFRVLKSKPSGFFLAFLHTILHEYNGNLIIMPYPCNSLNLISYLVTDYTNIDIKFLALNEPGINVHMYMFQLMTVQAGKIY